MTEPLLASTYIYVAPHNQVTGVHAPNTITKSCKERKCKGPHSSDWRAEPGSILNNHRAKPDLTRCLVSTAFETHHRTEAHVAAYVVLKDGVPLERQPRVCKDAVPWLRSQGFEVMLSAYLGDWDTPGHVPWTPEMLADFHALWARAEGPLATCGVYLSPKGSRLYQPLSRMVPVEEGEAGLRVWLSQLVRVGVDPSVLHVHDWTRLMRAPFHRRRGGEVVHASFVDFSRATTIDPIPAPPPVARTRSVREGREAKPRALPSSPQALAVLRGEWERLAQTVGEAIRDTVTAEWRRCYMAIAGAALQRGIDPGDLTAFVARAHMVDPQWAHQLPDRESIALSTLARFQSGQEITGYSTLAKDFPGVAAAFDARLSPAELRVRAQLDVAPPRFISVGDAVQIIRSEIASVRGLVAIEAPPSTGKTHAVALHAQTLPPIGERAAPGARLAVSAPTHKLAKQTASKLRKSLHLFSPPAHTDANGSQTCIHADAARAFAAGGQSVVREFCDGRKRLPCERANTCPARAGMEGDEKANLVTGVHGLTGALLEYAGSSGTLVIDEPGEVLETARLTLDDLETATRYLSSFSPMYASRIAPALAALDAWVREIGAADAPSLVLLTDAILAGVSAVPSDVIVGAGLDPYDSELGEAVCAVARSAIAPDATSKAPPLPWRVVASARSNVARAIEIGRASRVLNLLWRGLTNSVPSALRIDERSGERAATITGPNEHLLLALQHQSVVLLDANASLHLPALEKIIGYKPKLVSLAVPDGAPIERTIIVNGGATRKRWQPRGVPEWEAIAPSLQLAIAWLAEDPSCESAALLCPKEIATAISWTLRPDSAETRKLVTESRVGRRALEHAAVRLAPLLSSCSCELLVGYFGALEGLDHFSHCDATITLGDPRPNVTTEVDKALFLGLDPDGRLDALAAAELQQAHGRLRTVHRTRPGRQLHIGAIVPAGWPGLPVSVRRMPAGRPKTEPAGMSPEQIAQARALSGLSLRAFARALDVSPSTVGRYESGERVVPDEVARAVRSLVPSLGPSVPESTVKYITNRGFGNTPPLRGFREQGGIVGSAPTTTGVSGTPPTTGVSGTPADYPDSLFFPELLIEENHADPTDDEIREVASW